LKKSEMHVFGHTLLRVFLGLMFLIAGINKLSNPSGVTSMLDGFGFPGPLFFAWVLILSEIIFGALILLGIRVQYTTLPLAFVLFIAWIFAVLPRGVLSSNSFFHLIAIVALINIALTGPGKFALTK